MEEIDLFKKLLGEHLKAKRKAYRYSQERVAELANTGTDHLGRIERGEKQPTVYTIYKLCDSLDIDISLLFNEIKVELIKYKSDDHS